jgi:hypothetical protein
MKERKKKKERNLTYRGLLRPVYTIFCVSIPESQTCKHRENGNATLTTCLECKLIFLASYDFKSKVIAIVKLIRDPEKIHPASYPQHGV